MRQVVRAQGFVLIALVSALSGPIAGQAQTRTPLIQSVDMHIPVPPIPVTIAGKRHLAYELHLTNFRAVAVALTRIEVLNADRRTRLADFRDSELASRLGRPGAPADLAHKRVRRAANMQSSKTVHRTFSMRRRLS